MKGDYISEIMEKIQADGVELLLEDIDKEEPVLSQRKFYTKEEWDNDNKYYNYEWWHPWFWKKMNGKINYLYEISSEGYMKWIEEQDPNRRLNSGHVTWRSLAKFLFKI